MKYPWICKCSDSEKENISSFYQEKEYFSLEELAEFDRRIIDIKKREAVRISKSKE